MSEYLPILEESFLSLFLRRKKETIGKSNYKNTSEYPFIFMKNVQIEIRPERRKIRLRQKIRQSVGKFSHSIGKFRVSVRKFRQSIGKFCQSFGKNRVSVGDLATTVSCNGFR